MAELGQQASAPAASIAPPRSMPPGGGAAAAEEASSQVALGGPFTDVLCAVDGTRSSFAAVEQAAALAGASGRLTLLTVTAPSGAGRFRSAALGLPHATRVIAQAERIARPSGVQITSGVDQGGPPAAVIVERARDHDLLAIGSPSHAPFGSIGASVATETLRTFTTPLLLAHPAAQGPLTSRIVVASDGSEGSDALVALAAALAGERCERIALVHAQGPESQAHPHRIHSQWALLERVCAERAIAIIEPSDPCELIAEAVKGQRATLAVIGSRRLRGMGAVLGSVSKRAVRALGCSVLVIPLEGLGSRPAA